ncbi:MAG: NAD(P)/FAD-dependent oxidoreductase [Ruminococcaceae bacterium]|nr:NAD(P)/FAD-dependent oxidoreductase [Oscillospiraceae bacterium]
MLDVVIIGSGIIGAAIARELARFELNIAVLDRASDVAEGTTKANSAIVHAGFDALPGSLKAKYNIAGSNMFAAWSHELDSPYKRNTSLVLAFNPAEELALKELIARGRTNGVPGLRLIDRAEILQREPALNPLVTKALLAETGAICSPYELTIRLCEQAAANGVDFRLNCRVDRVQRFTDNKRNSAAASTQPYFLLTTNQGPIEAQTVVNAAGVYADIFNNQVSADHFTITPNRGEYLMLDKVLGPVIQATVFQTPTTESKGVLITPTVEGTFLIGPNSRSIEDRDDLSTTATGLIAITRKAQRSWPDLPLEQTITSFAGLRARSDRRDFIIGEAVDCPGFFNAAGMESPGLSAAPAVALELSAQISAKLSARPKINYLPVPAHISALRTMDTAERAAAAAADPAYGNVICRCETVSEAEIRAAIRRNPGAHTVDAVKRRTRAGMGRCQGSFCLPRVVAILAEELGILSTEVTKNGNKSYILTGTLQDAQRELEGRPRADD